MRASTVVITIMLLVGAAIGYEEMSDSNSTLDADGASMLVPAAQDPVDAASTVDMFATPRIRVFFSPHYDGQSCLSNIVKEVGKATNSVWMQAYLLSSDTVIQSLVNAKKKGRNVEIIIDRSSTNYTQKVDYMRTNGVSVLVDARHAIMHNKIIIVDDRTVITGSYNFTGAAEKANAENILVIRDKLIASQYKANYLLHKAHSTELLGVSGTNILKGEIDE